MDSSSSWWYISLVVFLCMSFSLLPDTTHLHHSRQSVERQKVGPQKFVLNRNMQLLVLFFFLYCYKTVRMPFSIYHAKEKLVRLASSGYLIQHNVQFLFRFTLKYILMYCCAQIWRISRDLNWDAWYDFILDLIWFLQNLQK